MKKVFVSGCYDLLHSGHVEFFRQASLFSESPIYNKVENGLMRENNMAIVLCTACLFYRSGCFCCKRYPKIKGL